MKLKTLKITLYLFNVYYIAYAGLVFFEILDLKMGVVFLTLFLVGTSLGFLLNMDGLKHTEYLRNQLKDLKMNVKNLKKLNEDMKKWKNQ